MVHYQALPMAQPSQALSEHHKPPKSEVKGWQTHRFIFCLSFGPVSSYKFLEPTHRVVQCRCDHLEIYRRTNRMSSLNGR